MMPCVTSVVSEDDVASVGDVVYSEGFSAFSVTQNITL